MSIGIKMSEISMIIINIVQFAVFVSPIYLYMTVRMGEISMLWVPRIMMEYVPKNDMTGIYFIHLQRRRSIAIPQREAVYI